ncbi:hypothetical protein RhiirA1_478239 [Rhizophagus irregularis]|uniref:Uncharacterized protein n=1 Tax=Rhizophagus irregularis TaxID=588596 RepID=A0A2N0QSB9_9GLOM|nr:hypothetical protein RhiirA1_478239 [Rhizophagus irregularis]
MQFATNPFATCRKGKIFSGSDMKILQEIIKEYSNYYLDEIVREMINKTEEEVIIPTLWRYNKICGKS